MMQPQRSNCLKLSGGGGGGVGGLTGSNLAAVKKRKLEQREGHKQRRQLTPNAAFATGGNNWSLCLILGIISP